jgi:uncharacterized membrane protein YfcA
MAVAETLIILLLASIPIGVVGSLLGIGGGVFLIPIMTLGLGIDIKVAAATSLVTIIVTSSTSAPKYLREGMVNVSLGMFLEVFTVTGAIIGAVLVWYLSPSLVEAIFAIVLIYVAVYMTVVMEGRTESHAPVGPGQPASRFSGRLRDESTGEMKAYGVKNLPKGAVAGFIAGNLSGLIGVGGGVVKVPAMHIWMGVPMKAAVATSNFMIGVTAVASALVYLANGYVAPLITAAAAVGIFIGATVGSRSMRKITGRGLRLIFSVVILIISMIMFLRAGGLL